MEKDLAGRYEIDSTIDELTYAGIAINILYVLEARFVQRLYS